MGQVYFVAFKIKNLKSYSAIVHTIYRVVVYGLVINETLITE